ncbi:MAG: hypothetical protein LWY06_06260 [Firmicutes bacterium]|nr:hypothetical protein [Bacillota bacterium]
MLTWLVMAVFSVIIAGFLFMFLGKLGDGDIGNSYAVEKKQPSLKKQTPGFNAPKSASANISEN